jgi:hypothetical protein
VPSCLFASPFSDERLGLAHLSQAAKGVIIEGDSAVAVVAFLCCLNPYMSNGIAVDIDFAMTNLIC